MLVSCRTTEADAHSRLRVIRDVGNGTRILLHRNSIHFVDRVEAVELYLAVVSARAIAVAHGAGVVDLLSGIAVHNPDTNLLFRLSSAIVFSIGPVAHNNFHVVRGIRVPDLLVEGAKPQGRKLFPLSFDRRLVVESFLFCAVFQRVHVVPVFDSVPIRLVAIALTNFQHPRENIRDTSQSLGDWHNIGAKHLCSIERNVDAELLKLVPVSKPHLELGFHRLLVINDDTYLIVRAAINGRSRYGGGSLLLCDHLPRGINRSDGLVARCPLNTAIYNALGKNFGGKLDRFALYQIVFVVPRDDHRAGFDGLDFHLHRRALFRAIGIDSREGDSDGAGLQGLDRCSGGFLIRRDNRSTFRRCAPLNAVVSRVLREYPRGYRELVSRAHEILARNKVQLFDVDSRSRRFLDSRLLGDLLLLYGLRLDGLRLGAAFSSSISFGLGRHLHSLHGHNAAVELIGRNDVCAVLGDQVLAIRLDLRELEVVNSLGGKP